MFDRLTTWQITRIHSVWYRSRTNPWIAESTGGSGFNISRRQNPRLLSRNGYQPSMDWRAASATLLHAMPGTQDLARVTLTHCYSHSFTQKTRVFPGFSAVFSRMQAAWATQIKRVTIWLPQYTYITPLQSVEICQVWQFKCQCLRGWSKILPRKCVSRIHS